MKSLFNAVLFFLLSLILFSGCQELGFKKKVTYPAQINSAMQAAFDNAEKEYTKKNYDKAIGLYEGYINGYEFNKLTDESFYKIGKIHFIRSNWGGVLDAMTHLKNKSPDPLYKAKAGLLAAHATFKNTDYQGAIRWLEQTRDSDLPDKMKLLYYSLKIFSGEQLGVARDILDYNYLRLADTYESSTMKSVGDITGTDIISRSAVVSKIDSWVISPMTPATLPSWFVTYPKGYARGFLEYKWGKVYFEAGETEKAKKKLTQFVSAYPKNRFADSARQLLDKLGFAVAENREENRKKIKVGVLLPLTGSKAQYGDSTLKGIRCAAGLAEGCADLASKFASSFSVELIEKDSASTPEEIAHQIQELEAIGVSAVIGPMSATLAEAAAAKANELRLPVFPITQKTDLMKNSDYVFQMGFEVSTQMSLLVREAKNKGVKSFAIFYPNNSYGQEMMAGFVRAAEASGSKVVTKVSYPPESADLTAQAHTLKTSVSRFEIGSTLGFGAVFVPDSFSALGRILPAFEMNSITDIPLLGTTAWNDPRLSSSALSKFPGTLYVDLFDTTSQKSVAQSFITAFKNMNGRPPTSIEALGFDALWAIRTAAQLQESKDKDRIKDGLLAITDLDGVTGISGFKLRQGPIVKPSVLSAQ